MFFPWRASHDGECRKMKTETKKLLEVVGNAKKTAANSAQKHLSEVARLTEEITALRKDGKVLLEKKPRCCSCGSNSKGLKTSPSGDMKLDQITATAKAEIQKLVSRRSETWHTKVLMLFFCVVFWKSFTIHLLLFISFNLSSTSWSQKIEKFPTSRISGRRNKQRWVYNPFMVQHKSTSSIHS